MSLDVIIAGVGMIPFTKPGASAPYHTMASTAARAALDGTRVDYRWVQQAYVGYVYGDSTAGQRALYEVGMTGIPIVNVNNNCCTGSTALFLARQAVAGGAADCVLALGFEQRDLGGAGLAHMRQYGTQLSTFAKIRAKASRHAANNPLAVFRTVVSETDVLASPMLWPGVMTRLMACPPTCGAAAAIVCSADFAKRHGLDASVRIRAQAMTTDQLVTFQARDMREIVGFGMAQEAARQVYESAGVGPEDIDVVELHDCFAQNELISYEALGLCPIGGAEKFVCDGDNTYDGRIVTNPSGGLLSKGHPLGATGLAQCTELVQQLRGTADKRQVDGARLALQHNLGLGGACVVTLYERVSENAS
jgi:acetyl-CoA acetyltransferase